MFKDEKYINIADKVLTYYKKYAEQNAIKVPYIADAFLVVDYITKPSLNGSKGFNV